MQLDSLLDAACRARPGGSAIRHWSFFGSSSRRLSLGIKDLQVGNPHAPLSLTESAGARYRLIWDDERVSRGYLERRQLEDDPLGALELARAAAYDDPDAAWVLGPSAMPEVELHDAQAAALSGGDTTPLIARLDAVRERVARHGFTTWSGSFSAGEGRSRLVTSAGLDVASEGTTVGWHVSVNGEIGDGFGARRGEPLEAFESRLDRLMDTALRLRSHGAPMAPGIHPVLLHPHVVDEYVLGTLFDNLGGSAVAHGEGHFQREQFGAEAAVLREDLGLSLDPLQPLKSGSYRFTSEGVPAAPCSFISRGRLVQPVLDLKYARRLGLAPTPVPFGMDTVSLDGPAPLPLERSLDIAAGGVLVLSVLGVHTQDWASGDFSLSAPQVLRIGARGFEGRLRGTISGNLFRLLRDASLHFVAFEGETTPGLLFPCRFDPR